MIRASLAAALLAAGGLGTGVAAAQGSDAPAHAAHSHAHARKTAASKSGATADEKEQTSYSLGVLLGTQLHQFGVDEHSVDFQKVEQGLKDVVSGKAHATAADAQKVQALVVQSRSAASHKNQAAAHRFLAENAKRPGVHTTASGLEYKVLKQGTGSPPQPTDEVTVNYRGTLLDGTEFDSSYKRGQPATLPLDHVIKGWREALVMMKPGAKWELFVPPDLAYGDNSPAPQIPPGSMLKFDVELLSSKAPAIAPQGAEPPSGGAGPNVGAGAPH